MGFLALSPGAAPGSAFLRHSLTGESALLGEFLFGEGQPLEGRCEGRDRQQLQPWTLTFSDGFGLLWHGGAQAGWAGEVLEAAVYIDAGRWFTLAAGQALWLKHDTWQKSFHYLDIPLVGTGGSVQVKLWVVAQYAVGCRLWFETMDFFKCAQWGKQAPSTALCNQTPCWERFAASLGLSPSLAIKRGMHAKCDDSARILENHALSSTGLLLFFLHASGRKRKEEGKDLESKYRGIFFSFLDFVLGGRDLVLDITVAKAAVDVSSSLPPLPQTSIAVSSCAVNLGEALGDCPVLQKGLGKALVKQGLDPCHCHLAALLLALMAGGTTAWRWLLAQLVCCLGKWLDMLLPALCTGADPVSAARKRARDDIDEDAADEMAMGHGIGTGMEVDGGRPGSEQHANAASLVKSAVSLGITKHFSIQKRWCSILRRYYLAGRRAFSGCQKFASTVDASRFQSDALCGFVGSQRTPDADFFIQCAPPQVFRVLTFWGVGQLWWAWVQ